MGKDTRRLNPEITIVPQGYNSEWIKNPDYPDRSLDEELLVATWDTEC